MKEKMTKKFLSDYQKNKRDLPILEQELADMKMSIVGVREPDHSLYECRKEAYEKKKEQVAAVEKWIEGISDGQTRCVFRMRYIDGMSWLKIAMKTGYGGNMDYPRKMIRDRYLVKNNIR